MNPLKVGREQSVETPFQSDDILVPTRHPPPQPICVPHTHTDIHRQKKLKWGRQAKICQISKVFQEKCSASTRGNTNSSDNHLRSLSELGQLFTNLL